MYHCGSCDTAIFSEAVYTAHLKGAERPLRCSLCTGIFTSPCTFEMHNAERHDGQAGVQPHTWKPTRQPQAAVGLGIRIDQPSSRQCKTPGVLRRRVATTACQVPSLSSGNPVFIDSPSHTTTNQTETLKGEVGATVIPQGQEVDLIEFDDVPEEDEFQKMQKAIAKFKEMVISRRRAEASSAASSQWQMLSPGVTEASSAPLSDTPQSASWESMETSSAEQTGILQPGFLCTKCGYSFPVHSDLLQHQEAMGHNYCRICHIFFAEEPHLQAHYARIHYFTCLGCPLIYTTVKDLADHQRESGHGYCAICDCYFISKSSHEAHAAKVHDFECTTCTGDVKRDSGQEKNESPGADNYCRQCDEALDTGETMAGHVAGRHPYRCTETGCAFAAPKYANLREHQREAKHNFCIPCSRPFHNRAALIEHHISDDKHGHVGEPEERVEAREG